MKNYSQKDLSHLLTLYLDGMLDGDELRECEEYIASHPEARKELDDLRRVKHLLSAQRPVAPDPYFWTRLSAELESRGSEDENLLPFPRKYVPLAGALTILGVVAIGVTLFLERGPLMQYLSERSHAVQRVYEANVLKGAIMPLFSHINNDGVLQFALFGTLPLDAKAETALRVDEGNEQGYRIEVGKTSDQKAPPVTVRDLYTEVQPTKTQEQLIDSVLEEARGQIEKGAFYAENNALAIDPALTKLNRAVLSNIAAVLAPVQRARFNRFLDKRNATFAVAESEAEAPAEQELEMRELRRVHRTNRFIVITADSMVVTPLALNIDSLIRMASPAAGPPMVAGLSVKLERLMRSHFDKRIAVGAQWNNEKLPVRMENEEDFFKIEFGPQLVSGTGGSVRVWMKPRERSEKTFRFDHRGAQAGLNVVSSPEGQGVRVEVNFDEIDSMMRMLEHQRFRSERDLRMLDSLMRARAKKLVKTRPLVVPDSAGP